jgi:hypothetical protein
VPSLTYAEVAARQPASESTSTPQYYDRDWTDPVNYHMVLNTGALGLEGAAGAIVWRAEQLGWGRPAG